MRRSQARRSGTDDGDAESVRPVVLARCQEAGQVGHLFDAVAGPLGELARRAKMAGVLVGHKPLESADGNGLVDRSAPAGSLAGSAADPSADGGERIGPAGNQVRAFVVSSGDGADVTPGVCVDRAGVLALDLSAPIVLVWHSGRKPSFRRQDHLSFDTADSGRLAVTEVTGFHSIGPKYQKSSQVRVSVSAPNHVKCVVLPMG